MSNNPQTLLITGSAGFIGSNLVLRLLESDEPLSIVGLDNLNDYYDPSLKEYRLRKIQEKAATAPHHTYKFIKGDLADKVLIEKLFEENHFDIVVNLAAQAGVRYSIENPDAYIQSNMIGFYNILEACRHHPVQHLVYASSSSVYGGNKKVPFSTDDRVDNPVSLYAATKKSNELFAHCYSKLYNIPTTGLRFFTVYGPAGRSTTTATADAISPMSMTSWKASSASCAKPRKRRSARTGFPSLRMPSTTSAAASPRTCWTLSISSRRNLLELAYSPKTMTSRPIRNSYPCSLEMSRPPMPMHPLSNGISGLRRRLR